MLDKSFHFVCFPKHLGVCPFPTIFTSFFQKIYSFFLKSQILVGGRQTKNKIFKMKSLNVVNAFSSTGCTKSFKFERVLVVQTHADNEENAGFFLFFQKKRNLV
jgi:hypothetical protein